jgi:predicted transcriptional regulator
MPSKKLVSSKDEGRIIHDYFIDGFNKKGLYKLQKELKTLNNKTRKIRGVKKEENNRFIRLVDAICGLVRQVKKGNYWAGNMLSELKMGKILKIVKNEKNTKQLIWVHRFNIQKKKRPFAGASAR